MQFLIFLTEKEDSGIKGWTAAGSSIQRSCMLKEEAISAIVAT